MMGIELSEFQRYKLVLREQGKEYSPEAEEALKITNAWYWAFSNEIKLVAAKFSWSGHEFQQRPMSVRPPEKVIRKSTQGTFTEGEVLNTLQGMITGYYKKGVYYLFPSKDKVSDFSKSRFKPLIDDNPDIIGQFVKGTDSATLKRIRDAFLYFRSGRLGQDIGGRGDMKSSANLKGDPADHAVFDEYDEMDMKSEEFVDGRLAKSEIGTKSFLANPTIPDYASDTKFQKSSQEYWHCKCIHCGWYTCLDLEEYWPEDGSPCLAIRWRKDGTAYRACRHCGKELYPQLGQWVAKKPDIKDILGFTIGHASYPWINVTKLLKVWESPDVDRGNFIRLRLGRPYIEAENRLTHQQIYDCCGKQGMYDSDAGSCSMGVDQGGGEGDLFHVVVGKKITIHSTIKAQILKLSILKGWDELDKYMKRFNIYRCVIDGLPNQKDAYKFANRHKGKVFLSFFSEHQSGPYKWDEKDFKVNSYRTDAMDESHEELAAGALLLPHRSKLVDKYADHCHATAKKLETDEKTGTKRYIYIPKLGGPDHFRLAQAYETMARMGKSKQRYQ